MFHDRWMTCTATLIWRNINWETVSWYRLVYCKLSLKENSFHRLFFFCHSLLLLVTCIFLDGVNVFGQLYLIKTISALQHLQSRLTLLSFYANVWILEWWLFVLVILIILYTALNSPNFYFRPLQIWDLFAQSWIRPLSYFLTQSLICDSVSPVLNSPSSRKAKWEMGKNKTGAKISLYTVCRKL